MSDHSPTLHLVCGKIASGKSTLARQLSEGKTTVLVAEDEWLAALYPDEMKTLADYVRCSSRLRQAMGEHVVALLGAGVSVVLDFPANTLQSRAWMKGMIDRSGAAHTLHVVDTPDDVCLARLRRRNEGGEHPFTVTEHQFEAISAHFVPPSAEEGFEIVWSKI